MENLIEGYRRFRTAYFEQNRALFRQLANGQSPDTMVIACCDSRVAPSLIFNARPGEIFTLRNIANLVPPYTPDGAHHSTSAAIEFAVKALRVKDIVVLGHSGCGGVKALLEGQQGEFVGPWMQIASEARDHALALATDGDPERTQLLCEFENIRISLRNLRRYPWVGERVAHDGLTLHGWYFQIERGDLYILNEETQEFAVAAA